jgi:hypothetical protein
MNNYTWEYIQNHQKETKRLLGINYQQLQDLMEYVILLEEKDKKEKDKKKVRINKAGGGRNCLINRQEQIILTLIPHSARQFALCHVIP